MPMKSVNGSIEIVIPKSSGHLSESRQSVPIKFAMAKVEPETGKRIALHQWILCRDFFNEIVLGNKIKKVMFVHGFRVDEDLALDKKHTRYLIKCPDMKVMNLLLKHAEIALPLFNEFFHHITKTTVSIINKEKHMIEVIASKQWQRMTQTMSYHTQFLRLLANPVLPVGTSYPELWKTWRDSINKQERNEYNYSSDVDIDRLNDVTTPSLKRLHTVIYNYLDHLRVTPKVKVFPQVDMDEDSYNDGHENAHTMGVYDFHDEAGWFSLATKLQWHTGDSFAGFYNMYPHWDHV